MWIGRGGAAAAGSDLAAEMGKGKEHNLFEVELDRRVKFSAKCAKKWTEAGRPLPLELPTPGRISWSTRVWRNFNPTGLVGCTSSISHQWGWAMLHDLETSDVWNHIVSKNNMSRCIWVQTPVGSCGMLQSNKVLLRGLFLFFWLYTSLSVNPLIILLPEDSTVTIYFCFIHVKQGWIFLLDWLTMNQQPNKNEVNDEKFNTNSLLEINDSFIWFFLLVKFIKVYLYVINLRYII